MEKSSLILVTGAGGLVGTSLLKVLREEGFENLLVPTSSQVDFRDSKKTNAYFLDLKPEYVFHMAARVYGIMGNMENKGVSFYENVMINTNVVEATRLAGCRKIVAMGSGAVYPFPPPQRYLEEADLWKGEPHPSEDSYAHSKRAMHVQLQAYKEQYGLKSAFAISGNLYGPNDKFDAAHGHVTPALIAKFFEAKRTGQKVNVWGDGSAVRDFTYSDDMARALLVVMQFGEGAINVGSGDVRPIKDVVTTIAELTGMTDQISWDASKPNGQPFRAYSLEKLFALGFTPTYSLREGLKETIDWYDENHSIARH